MVSIKQLHTNLLSTMRMEVIQRMNEIGHGPGGHGAVGVAKAGGVPFHMLEYGVEEQCGWVLSFVAGRCDVTSEDYMGMMTRLNQAVGAHKAVSGVTPVTGTFIYGQDALELAPVRHQLATSMHARSWSIHGQLRSLVCGRVDDLMDTGLSMDQVATMAGIAAFSLERIMDKSQEAEFREMEETARMLDVSLLLTGAVDK